MSTDHHYFLDQVYATIGQVGQECQAKYATTLYIAGPHALALYGAAPPAMPHSLTDIDIALVAGTAEKAVEAFKNIVTPKLTGQVRSYSVMGIEDAQTQLMESLAMDAPEGTPPETFSGAILGVQTSIRGAMFDKLMGEGVTRHMQTIMVLHPSFAMTLSPDHGALRAWMKQDMRAWSVTRRTVLNVATAPRIPGDEAHALDALMVPSAPVAAAEVPKAEAETEAPEAEAPEASEAEVEGLKAELELVKDKMRELTQQLLSKEGQMGDMAAKLESVSAEKVEAINRAFKLEKQLEMGTIAQQQAEKGANSKVTALSAELFALEQSTKSTRMELAEVRKELQQAQNRLRMQAKEMTASAGKLQKRVAEAELKVESMKKEAKKVQQKGKEMKKQLSAALQKNEKLEKELGRVQTEVAHAKAGVADAKKWRDQRAAHEAELKTAQKQKREKEAELKALQTEFERVSQRLVASKQAMHLLEQEAEAQVEQAIHSARLCTVLDAASPSGSPSRSPPSPDSVLSPQSMGSSRVSEEEDPCVYTERGSPMITEEEARRRTKNLVRMFREEREAMRFAVQNTVYQFGCSSVSLAMERLRCEALMEFPFVAEVDKDGFFLRSGKSEGGGEPWHESVEKTIPWEMLDQALSGAEAGLPLSLLKAIEERTRDDGTDQALEMMGQQQELFTRVRDLFWALKRCGDPSMSAGAWHVKEAQAREGVWWRAPEQAIVTGLWAWAVHASVTRNLHPILVSVLLWARTEIGKAIAAARGLEEAVEDGLGKGMRADLIVEHMVKSGICGGMRIFFVKASDDFHLTGQMSKGIWHHSRLAGIHVIMDVEPFIKISQLFAGSRKPAIARAAEKGGVTRDDIHGDTWVQTCMQIVSGIAGAAFRVMNE